MSTAPRHPAEALEELAAKLREEWSGFQPGVAYEPVDPDLHKDAARYRWLRADHAYFPEEMGIFGGPDLDAAIDAAIEEERHDPRDP